MAFEQQKNIRLVILKNLVLPHTIPFFLFFLLAVYLTYPLLFNLGKLTTGFGDELLIAWIHSWVLHALSTSPFELFNANIFYPHQNTLAHSDLFLTTSLLSFLPLKLIGEPIVAVNFTLITSLALLGFTVYLLTFYITKNIYVSFISGVLVIFSPAVLDKKVHLQILSIYFVPLAILFFLIFIKRLQKKYLLLSLMCFLLQTYNSFLPGYFILFSYVVITLCLFIYNKTLFRKLITRETVVLFLFSLLLLVPIIIPYYQVSKQFNYTRDLRDAIHFSLQPEDFLFMDNTSRLKPIISNIFSFKNYPKSTEFKNGYLGLEFSLLTIFSFFYLFKKFEKKNIVISSFLIIALIGLILSLGPALHLGGKTIHNPFPIPLPYALFYYILPGFSGFRNSARWEMLFIIFMAVVIGIVLQEKLKNVESKLKIGIYIFLCAAIIGEYNFPIQFYSAPQKNAFPSVHQWLITSSPDISFIELPIYDWDMHPYVTEELKRGYYSTIHFRKMVNGYSGFFPPDWLELVPYLSNNFPSEESIVRIKNIGVNYIIVDKDQYDLLNKNKFKVRGKEFKNGDKVIADLIKNEKVKLLKKFDNSYVFAFK